MHIQSQPSRSSCAVQLKRMRVTGRLYAARVPEPVRDAIAILIGLAILSASVLVVLALLSFRM